MPFHVRSDAGFQLACIVGAEISFWQNRQTGYLSAIIANLLTCEHGIRQFTACRAVITKRARLGHNLREKGCQNREP